MLLKTASDVLLQVAGLQQVRGTRLRPACWSCRRRSPQPFRNRLTLALPPMQLSKQHRLATEGPQEGKSNSVDSSSTAAGAQGHAHHLVDSATHSLLPPLRQISLDVIAAGEFNRAKGLAPERQSIFQDVFEQVRRQRVVPTHLAACVWHAQHVGLTKVAVRGQNDHLWQQSRGAHSSSTATPLMPAGRSATELWAVLPCTVAEHAAGGCQQLVQHNFVAER